MKQQHWLSAFRSNVFSDGGEDGVIAKILDILPDTDQWCVEFGAADGVYYSNTRRLLTARGYRGVLIEANREQFKKLQATYRDDSNVITINAEVGFSAHDNLDQLLGPTPVPRDFSFLSVDIDGNDYHVWEATYLYSPRVVCIEFNPTIPAEVTFVQPPDRSVMQGSSLRALFELGKNKGYELVSVLRTNAIFVRNDYFHLFGISENDPAVLRDDLDDVTYLFSGYDGTIFLRGSRMLPWHGIDLREERFQLLPRCFRMYPNHYTATRRAAYALYLLWCEPRTAVRKIRAWYGRRQR